MSFFGVLSISLKLYFLIIILFVFIKQTYLMSHLKLIIMLFILSLHVFFKTFIYLPVAYLLGF